MVFFLLLLASVPFGVQFGLALPSAIRGSTTSTDLDASSFKRIV
jgi:hypothetical protein